MKLIIILLLSFPLLAENFENSYFSFQVPSGWYCEDFDQRVFCNQKDKHKPNDAVLYCAYREKLPIDTSANFKKRLLTITTKKDTHGKTYKNKIIFTKENKIKNIVFLDSLQFASEWPDHYTRYLATVHNNLALLCTFSVIENDYKSYLPDFLSILDTLTIYPTKRMIIAKPKTQNNIEEDNTDTINQENASTQKPKENIPADNSTLTNFIFIFLALIGLAILFVILKKRK